MSLEMKPGKSIKVCDCLLDIVLFVQDKMVTSSDLWNFIDCQDLMFWCYGNVFLGCCYAHLDYLIESVEIQPKCNQTLSRPFVI